MADPQFARIVAAEIHRLTGRDYDLGLKDMPSHQLRELWRLLRDIEAEHDVPRFAQPWQHRG